MTKKQLSLFEEIIKRKDRRKLILSQDKIYLFFILLIIVGIVSFSVGVEKGKNIDTADLNLKLPGVQEARKAQYTSKLLLDQDEPLPTQQPAKIGKEAREDSSKVVVEKSAPLKKDETVYSIQVATYSGKKMASVEAEKIKENSLDAFLIQKGQYIILCVGKFNSKEDAEALLKRLKQQYKDCFIRKL